MSNPTISMPEEVKTEADRRRPSTVSRSQYVCDALRVRFVLEDSGDWDEIAERVQADNDSAADEE